MKDYEFLDAVGGIDKRFIEKADVGTTKRPVWKYVMPVAACLVLMVGVYFAYPKLSPATVPVPNPNGTIERTDEPETYPEHPILHPGDDGYIDPVPEPMPIEPGSVNFGYDNQTEIQNFMPMISGYGESTRIADMAVNNGKINFTESLTSAMNEYGDTANYRVLIELFQDGVQISINSETANQEAQRLIDMGLIVAMETVKHEENHGEYVTVIADYYLTLHATYEQLKYFSPSDDLGYSIMLYDEYFGPSTAGELVVFNGYSPTN